MERSPDFEALLASVRQLTTTMHRFADVLEHTVKAQLLMAEALKTLNEDLQPDMTLPWNRRTAERKMREAMTEGTTT